MPAPLKDPGSLGGASMNQPFSKVRQVCQGVSRAIVEDVTAILRNVRRSWRVLRALTVIEARRRYAGSVLGMLWYPAYSILLLASYCFVYLVVFKLRFRNLGTYDYVLMIFSGMIPYIGLSEAVNSSALSVRQNLALLRNAVFPIEFVPVKHVCAALVGTLSSFAILIAMVAPTPYMGWHVLYLPIAVGFLLLFCVMVGWILSAIAVFLPDIMQVINIGLLLLMFLSPVLFTVDIVPERLRLFIFFNPLTYLIESFRFAFLGVRYLPMWSDALFGLFCMVGAALAGSFFRRVSPIFADYE
jgi:lipopolysaccharide transport system permease protein